MEEILAAILCMLLVCGLFPLLWWRRRQISESEHEHQDEPQLRQTERVVQHSGARRMRRRPAAASSSTATTSSQEAHIESDEEVPEDDQYVAKASSKKEKKKQEREAQRQAEEAARESRKTKQDRYADMRRKKDEEREAQERLMEEEALARKAREEEAAALEFEKWKGEFSIDAEGKTESDVQDEGQGLLSNFVEYIKDLTRSRLLRSRRKVTSFPDFQKQKCVPLEELAAEFKLRTQDCINRIITLESMGRLSGVMDDRGKYIYISPEEMKAVADYIKREGRVSIAHLASKSNQFIDLEPKPHFDAELSSDVITVS